ncbi:hypothetical protein M427DRAFT_57566 [Gonapodya prolifera JEL478]|uniref:Uncharacterized protein n=1 Tax=Gonapodya prolifera (strain JEL478) TaxID=1344416 RepID=A0A139ACC0_GONPJ|nr:hypothetical protein M427DRAFT_57566 [Gonapodya prolifera JEL478]|eukprot:KXS14388.1 hypothetical protein M427DRAFT_57566 [Gonapodya prolifera JEL478]
MPTGNIIHIIFQKAKTLRSIGEIDRVLVDLDGFQKLVVLTRNDRVNAQFQSIHHARSAIELLRMADPSLLVQTSSNESVRPATGNPGSPSRILTFRANTGVLATDDVESIVRRRLRQVLGDSRDLHGVRRIEYGGEERFFIDFVSTAGAVRTLEALRRTTSLVVEYSKETSDEALDAQPPYSGPGGLVGGPPQKLGLGTAVTEPLINVLNSSNAHQFAHPGSASGPWMSPTTTMSTGSGGGNSPTDPLPQPQTSSGGSGNQGNGSGAGGTGKDSPRGSHGSRASDGAGGSPRDAEHPRARDRTKRDRRGERDRQWRDSNRSRSRSPRGGARGERRSRSNSREASRRRPRMPPTQAQATLGSVQVLDAGVFVPPPAPSGYGVQQTHQIPKPEPVVDTYGQQHPLNSFPNASMHGAPPTMRPPMVFAGQQVNGPQYGLLPSSVHAPAARPSAPNSEWPLSDIPESIFLGLPGGLQVPAPVVTIQQQQYPYQRNDQTVPPQRAVVTAADVQSQFAQINLGQSGGSNDHSSRPALVPAPFSPTTNTRSTPSTLRETSPHWLPPSVLSTPVLSAHQPPGGTTAVRDHILAAPTPEDPSVAPLLSLLPKSTFSHKVFFERMGVESWTLVGYVSWYYEQVGWACLDRMAVEEHWKASLTDLAERDLDSQKARTVQTLMHSYELDRKSHALERFWSHLELQQQQDKSNRMLLIAKAEKEAELERSLLEAIRQVNRQDSIIRERTTQWVAQLALSGALPVHPSLGRLGAGSGVGELGIGGAAALEAGTK